MFGVAGAGRGEAEQGWVGRGGAPAGQRWATSGTLSAICNSCPLNRADSPTLEGHILRPRALQFTQCWPSLVPGLALPAPRGGPGQLVTPI